MASRIASTSRYVIRSSSSIRQLTSAVRKAASVPPSPTSKPSRSSGSSNNSKSRKGKARQRDHDFLEAPPSSSTSRVPDRPMQELYPAIVAEQSEGKGSQDQECELEAEEVEEEDGNALPVQQIMSSDMESPKMPGGSKSATEVLMSLEPYHSQSNGSHEDQGYQQNSQQAQAGPIEGVPLPHPHAIIDSLPLRHPFNTADFVAALEAAGHSRPVAEAFMRATKHLLISEEEHSLANLVGKQDLENQAYLFRAALDELQTEVQVQCRNDAIALRSANGQLQREIDAVTQKLREDIHDLKNDIQIDFNTRKEESNADQKNLELQIIDLGNKFTVSLGEVRTELEAKKWLQTRRSLAMITTLVALVVFSTSLDSSAPPVIPPTQRVPTADELGLKPVGPESATPFSGNWLEKRVGEEDE